MSNTNEFIVENGVLVKYKGKELNVVIPDHVTHIGEKAFEKKAKITSVVIPEGVREIGAFAFSECRKLENIQLPYSLETVGEGAFFDCRNLNELILPPNTKVHSIHSIIAECRRLLHVVFPASAEFIPICQGSQLDFTCCYDLSYLTCPGVKLDQISPSRRLAAVRGYIRDIDRFTNAEVNQTYNEYLFKQKKNLLPLVFRLDAVHILEILAQNEKLKVKELEEAYLNPAMEANALNCVAFLMDWKNKNGGAETKRNSMVSELDRDPYSAGEMKKLWSTQKLADGTLEITSYKGDSRDVEIPPRIGKTPVTSLGERAFSPYRDEYQISNKPYERHKALNAIQSVSIPESVTSIGKYCFAGCKALTHIHIPETVERIDDGAFQKCTGLNKIVLPAGLKNISSYLFRKCDHLCNVGMPEKPEYIGAEAFSECHALEEISLPTEVKLVATNAFVGCDALVGENQLVIVNQTVHHCHPDAVDVVIPNGVTNISRESFAECRRLKRLLIPSSVTVIGWSKWTGVSKDYVFTKSKNLTIYTPAESFADQYAKVNRIPVIHIEENCTDFPGDGKND